MKEDLPAENGETEIRSQVYEEAEEEGVESE